MTKIRDNRSAWDIKPRLTSNNDGRPLTGFALDITIRFSAGVFLTDHNSSEGTLHFNTVDELCEFLTEQITRNYTEHHEPDRKD